ncbi:MAG: tetratricopeptide repeat protein [Bacillota bacterium]|nr:tetratricopeptide repeat protein [Bacillota bacterium]MDI9415473.1 tetratricopeptide repeat protein [Bacillota bacterium]NLD11984.1 tetratricopeptide repeat protein [Bacillota bacterium]HOB89358.1 tetratricopeptide repeat protein [Bacillota bacterium]HOJ58397.1 tetratricopeptide repeat protein [Bacillota bacterium]
MNTRRQCLIRKIVKASVIAISLSLLLGTWHISAEELTVEGLLKQMSLASAHVKDFECILESVYERNGVSETIVMKLTYKRPDKYSINYLAPESYEGTQVVQQGITGVVVNKDGSWKAYDSLTVQGLETLKFMLRFARDDVQRHYNVTISDKVSMEDRIAYVLVADNLQAPQKESEVFWIDNVRYLILQAETNDILGERTLLKLKKANVGSKGSWDSYVLSVIDLKGDLRGEITVTQVERGLYLPTQVNLITSYGSLSQVMKDIKLNTGVKDDAFVIEEAEEMRAKLKEAESAYSKGRFDKALAAYKRVIELDPENFYARSNMGLCYWHTGDTDNAILALETVLAQAPSYLPAYNNLGFILADSERDIKRAITLLETAVHGDPANPVYMDSLGWAYFRSGDLEEAELTIRRALLFDNLFPDKKALSTAHYHLAMVYEAMGRKEDAIAELQEALKEEPLNSKYRSELSRLRKN